jgi:hypothetical protein
MYRYVVHLQNLGSLLVPSFYTRQRLTSLLFVFKPVLARSFPTKYRIAQPRPSRDGVHLSGAPGGRSRDRLSI